MKKILFTSFLVTVFAVLTISTTVLAAEEYEFNLEYTGNVIVNEEKSANVTLSGTDATPYTNVKITIDFISGPATPKILATDTNGTEFDLGQLGYWGPPSGFAVGGTFSNVTPIKATFSKAGTYVSKLSLVDVNNSNAVITSKEFTVTVLENEPANNTTTENNVIANNTIEEIPQTGTSVWEYSLYALIIGITIFFVYTVMNKRKS